MTFLSKLGLVLGCFFGIFVLGIVNFISQHTFDLSTGERALYSFVVGHRTKQRFKLVSVVLIQRWWRFLTARKYKLSRMNLVSTFYLQLTTHRAEVLLARHATEFIKLDTQLHRTKHAICTKIAKTVHYLHALPYFRDLVPFTQATDFSRKQYSIELNTHRILRICKRRIEGGLPAPRPKRKILIQLCAVPELSVDSGSTSFRAKARDNAYLNVLGRVGRAWSSRSSPPSLEGL